MDEKNKPPVLKNDSDMEEIRNVMGDAFDRVDVTSASPLNPTAAPRPRRPGQGKTAVTPEGCIAPLFPIVPEEDVHLYQREDRLPDDVIGNYQKGKIDPELNELALREVARERGITVDQLLARNPDKKLEQKLEFADMEKQTPAVPPPRTMSVEDARKLLAEAEKAEADKAQQPPPPPKPRPGLDNVEQSFEKPLPPQRVAKRKMAPRKKHPLLQELRNEFSLDAVEPLKLTLKNHTFEMAPPPSSLHPWILTKIANAEYVNSPQAIKVAIRVSVVSAALYAIDGISTAEIFGLTDETDLKNENITPELRELMAQTVWEMIADVSTIEGLFQFDPQLVQKLFESYSEKFKDNRFISEQNDNLNRFACPLEDCKETYNLAPRVEGYYCRVHGTRMDDAGSLTEVSQIPLL